MIPKNQNLPKKLNKNSKFSGTNPNNEEEDEVKGCSCVDCEASCNVPDFSDETDEDFVIVEGVDGVVFIMVIIFIVGSIIFLAIIVGSTVLERNALFRKLFFLICSFNFLKITVWEIMELTYYTNIKI